MEFITFDDVAPYKATMSRLWHGTGMDRDGRIYAALSTCDDMFGGIGDALLYTYDTRTGEKRFLKTVRQIMREDGNLGPNDTWPRAESMAKIHPDIIEHGGKMYIGTCDIHILVDRMITRGGHFLEYDPRTGAFRDLSKDEPMGVSCPGEGFVAMNILRNENTLVGWTIPAGRVVLHDLSTGKSTIYPPGHAGKQLDMVSRAVVTTRKGDIYTIYSTGKYFARRGHMFKLDRESGTQKPIFSGVLRKGMCEGRVDSPDGRHVYLADFDGRLFDLDVEREELKQMASLHPGGIWRSFVRLRNLTLSKDGRKLYGLLTPHERLMGWWPLLRGAYHLYEYDLERGTTIDLGDFSGPLKHSLVVGNGLVDEAGRLYLPCYFDPQGHGGLLRVDVSSSIPPATATR
jgi:hypothetical protein